MIIKLKDLKSNISQKIQTKIFIYPTDTIYGLGCDAEDREKVKKIRLIKKRDEKPFSVIAPSLNWIKKNCQVNFEIEKYLPGPYTLILKKKNPEFLKHVSKTEYLGVRIPNHPFIKILQKTKKPIVTTSVNFSGEKPANSVKEINKKILKKVDFIIDGGKLSGKASKIIKEGKIVKR